MDRCYFDDDFIQRLPLFTDGTKEPYDPIDDILFHDVPIIPKCDYEDGLDTVRIE